MTSALISTCETINADLWVLITGAGRAFSAGGDRMLEMSAAMQALAHLTHIEGVSAVLEKRPADFTGR